MRLWREIQMRLWREQGDINHECGEWLRAGSNLATPLCVGLEPQKNQKWLFCYHLLPG